MAQFDLYTMRSSGTLVLDVQSELLDPLNTRVVIPVLPVENGLKPAKRLNPVFRIADQDRMLATQFLAAVPVTELGQAIDNLADKRDDVTAALDMLYQGI